MSLFLPPLFFVTALLYAAVGFGGGSTYNALLVLYGVDYRILPTIALACNIIVVSGGVWRFSRAGEMQLSRFWSFLITSIPAAWVGGRLPIAEVVFVGLLGFALLASGARLLFMAQPKAAEQASETGIALPMVIGATIGLLSGLVGIGGGIFLAPILYLMGWGTARQIAAACSLFILLNSLSGLGGQVTKLGDTALLSDVINYWPLLVAVLIGGQIGSWLGAGRLRADWMKRMTAILILYVALRLLWRWIGMI
ncbi:sulfite exporter TauE/SafE family protein [Hyphomonas sp. FCG-A18]|uniref:sulfite exporter TauE/SafE family protein n=1 Tax=Hyphomonas sp. FCG-A18 TaxID=3080019 RepID=UPI002B31A554|nr:sulfite exporter TauE/SafE family protein [Hyphomonas sp. FCG-A18]